ncbi:MAG: TIGR02206 family membrane protein [Verrucomicrobiota bacterium]
MHGFHEFRVGSSLHLLCLAICLLATVAAAAWSFRQRRKDRPIPILRGSLVVLSLSAFALSLWANQQNPTLPWNQKLPLHLCNLANLVGSVALVWRVRLCQALLYYWMFVGCVWAFVTPSLYEGIYEIEFWIFWFYHLCIPVSLAVVMTFDQWRPNWREAGIALAITVAYTMLIAVFNAATDSNYAFVGKGDPINPSPIDVLGPYPWRVGSVIGVGSLLFALFTLPWTIFRKRFTPALGDTLTSK